MSVRIVSLCPSNTEIVCALGLAEALVGVDLYSDWPPEVVRGLPRVGPDLHVDVEKVKALKPDLVLASLSVPGMERVVEEVQAAGLPTLVLNPQGLEDTLASLTEVADAVARRGVTVAAETVQRILRGRIDRVAERTQRLRHRPRLYWEWWPRPIYSPGGGNWLTELSWLAGGENVFANEPGPQVCDPSGDRVVAAKPDVILAVWTGVPQHKVPLRKMIARPGWDKLPAIQSGRLYALHEGLFCRPSPRLVDGLEQLVRLLHPDLADELGLPEVSAYAPVLTLPGK